MWIDPEKNLYIILLSNRVHPSRANSRIHPVRRYGTPEDVAGLVLWLASDEAGYASGQLWVLDGGLTAQAQQMRL